MVLVIAIQGADLLYQGFQALSKTHITHLILLLAAANLTRLEQEVVSFYSVCQENLRNAVYTLLNHIKSSHQNPCN